MARLPKTLVRFKAFLAEADEAEKAGYNELFGCYAGIVIAIILLAVTYISFATIKKEIFFFILFFSAFLGFWILSKVNFFLKKKRSRHDPLHETYSELLSELRNYSERGTLGERMHPAVAIHLEQTADQYFKVRKWLSEKSSKNILGEEMHEQVQNSIRSAMREIVFSIHGAYRPQGMVRKTWEKMVASDPDAVEVTNNLAKLSGLLTQLNEIMIKAESLGATITLTDQLKAISAAISEMETLSSSNIKSLGVRKL